MHSDDLKYFQQNKYYFGEKTIYTHLEELMKNKGITPKHPLSYEYKDFDPPLYITLMSSNAYGYRITITVFE